MAVTARWLRAKSDFPMHHPDGEGGVMPKTKKAMREVAAAREPRGALSIRILCMPADTNQYGDIFGGCLLGQMDIAGGLFASKAAGGAPRRSPSTP
jgi:hypothetical protein